MSELALCNGVPASNIVRLPLNLMTLFVCSTSYDPKKSLLLVVDEVHIHLSTYKGVGFG